MPIARHHRTRNHTHFQYPDVVKAALQRAHSDLQQPTMLSDLAQQFGQTTGAWRALRYALDEMEQGRVARYDRTKSSHALGGVLVAAVYEAFVSAFKRRLRAWCASPQPARGSFLEER